MTSHPRKSNFLSVGKLMKHIFLCLWSVLLLALPVRGDDLLLYAPFDGSADAAIARGDARNLGGLGLNFIGGIRGQAIVLENDCRFATPGNFRPEQGAVAVWVRPRWNGSDATSHYVFCIYGQRDLPHAWAVNRWNVAFGDGKCAFTIFTRTEGKTFSVCSGLQLETRRVASRRRDLGERQLHEARRRNEAVS